MSNSISFCLQEKEPKCSKTCLNLITSIIQHEVACNVLSGNASDWTDTACFTRLNFVPRFVCLG